MIHAVVTSSVLIPVILFCRKAFRKRVSQRLIYGLWLLVALRLAIPVQIGCIPLGKQAPLLPATQILGELSQTPVAGEHSVDAGAHIPEGGMPDTEQGVLRYAPASLGDIARLVWLAGVAAVGLWLSVVNVRHKKQLLKNATVLGLEGCPIPVLVSPKAESPCLVGVFRPKAVLPPKSATETHLKYVMAHELSHYRHGDHIWAMVRGVCLCLYWFHPLVWVAAFCSRRDCELACDEGAIDLLGEKERLAYGAVLVATAAGCSRKSPAFTPNYMANAKTQLKERMELIVRKQKNLLGAAVCMLMICVLCAGCAFLGGQEPEEAVPVEQPNVTATEPAQLESDSAAGVESNGNSDATTVQDTAVVHFIYESSYPYPNSRIQDVFDILQNHEACYSPDYVTHSVINPHYLGVDGGIYFVSGRNSIVRTEADGTNSVEVYIGKNTLYPIVCDGAAFYFLDGENLLMLDCLSGEVASCDT